MTKPSQFFDCSLIIIILAVSSPVNAQNLTDIYTLALQNDPTIKQAMANQMAISETKDQSLARFFPNISAAAASSKDYLHNKRAGSDFRGLQVYQDYWSHTFSLNFTQPIFHWDHWVQLSRADNQVAQAEATYQSELQNLMMKTAETYFNVLAAQDNLEFALAEKQSIERQLEQAKRRFEVGIVAITDVNEAQAGYFQADANVIEAQNILDNSKEALKEIIGELDLNLDMLIEQIPLQKPDPANINEWSSIAETNNYSILAALNQSEAARKTIDIQRNGHLPQLDMVASYGTSDVNSSFGFRGDTQSIGVQLNVPLFEGGAVNSRVRQAQYEYQASKENLSATKRQIKRQIKDAYRGVITNISRVEALSSAVISAETALEAAEAGFEVGTRTMVDVLAEQRFLYRAKRDYSRARYDYLINSIRLKQLSSNLSMADLDRISLLLLPPSKMPKETHFDEYEDVFDTPEQLIN